MPAPEGGRGDGRREGVTLLQSVGASPIFGATDSCAHVIVSAHDWLDRNPGLGGRKARLLFPRRVDAITPRSGFRASRSDVPLYPLVDLALQRSQNATSGQSLKRVGGGTPSLWVQSRRTSQTVALCTFHPEGRQPLDPTRASLFDHWGCALTVAHHGLPRDLNASRALQTLPDGLATGNGTVRPQANPNNGKQMLAHASNSYDA